ncbi:ribonuclease M5 [Fusibacter sp. JL298sf-3]
MKARIQEVIVVEGKDDESAVKAAVDCAIIITHGYGIRQSTFKRIEKAQKSVGVIIFTDPDYAGEQIRKRIDKRIKGCKHAFLSQEEATKDDDIGIENATPESILKALKRVRTICENPVDIFSKQHLLDADLLLVSDAADRRAKVGEILGIGCCNAKQFLNRLNRYGVTEAEFYDAVATVKKEA